jgi:hypothetical protein
VISAMSAALTNGVSRTNQGSIRAYPLNTLKGAKIRGADIICRCPE